MLIRRKNVPCWAVLTLFYTDNIMYIYIYIIFFFFPSLYIICTRSNAVGNKCAQLHSRYKDRLQQWGIERKIVGNAQAHLEGRPIAGIV